MSCSLDLQCASGPWPPPKVERTALHLARAWCADECSVQQVGYKQLISMSLHVDVTDVLAGSLQLLAQTVVQSINFSRAMHGGAASICAKFEPCRTMPMAQTVGLPRRILLAVDVQAFAQGGAPWQWNMHGKVSIGKDRSPGCLHPPPSRHRTARSLQVCQPHCPC